jgi:hypothetical protein
MTKLAMTAALDHLTPAILLQHPNNVPNLHQKRRVVPGCANQRLSTRGADERQLKHVQSLLAGLNLCLEQMPVGPNNRV